MNGNRHEPLTWSLTKPVNMKNNSLFFSKNSTKKLGAKTRWLALSIPLLLNSCDMNDDVEQLNQIQNSEFSVNANALIPSGFTKTFGGSLSETLESIKPTADGGYLTTGYSYSSNGDVSSNNGGQDAWVIKLDEDGELEWESSYFGSADETALDILPLTDGGFIIVGKKGNRGWVLKVDSNKNAVWEKLFGSNKSEVINIELTSDGNYLVSGRKDDKAWVGKFNTLGGELWQRSYGQSFGSFRDMEKAPDGSFYALGNQNAVNLFLVKFNSAGNQQWQREISDPYSYDYGNAVAALTDGGSVSVGTQNDLMNREDLFLVKHDANGNELWRKVSAFDFTTDLYAIGTADGGFLVWANLSGDVKLFKYNASGNLQWTNSYGGSAYDGVRSILETSDNQFILVGSSQSSDGDVNENKGESDAWIFAIDEDGNF